MALFMIAAIGDISNPTQIIGYRLLDMDSKQCKDVPVMQLIQAMTNGLQLINAELQHGKIVGTNGSINRYPLIVNGIPYNKSPLMVLKVMNNGDYMVTDFKGEIARMKPDEAIRYSELEGIANGKIVMRDGTKFISAISGEYEQEPQVDVEKSASKIMMKMDLIDNRDFKFNSANEFLVCNRELKVVKVPTGVVRIAEYAFQNMTELTTVTLPEKVDYIGTGAFLGCKKLESVTISNGVKIIPAKCFADCTSLKEIEIPASVVKIESRAFDKCRNLKKIYLKNPSTYIEFGALPTGCRKIVR